MLRTMRYIYEVYKEMNFSRAAKNLYISQPSLSAAVKKEEGRLGFPIFDRSTSPIRLTEFGKEYIRFAEIIMDAESGFQNYVNDLTELKSGSLTIGGTNFFISYVLPPLLCRFINQYPLIHVELIEGSTPELTDKLNAGVLDLLLDYSVLDPGGYARKTIKEEHLLMAVPAAYSSNENVRGYALGAADIKAGVHLGTRIAPVPMCFFQDEPFLLLREGNDTRERAMNICRSNQFQPRVKLELEQQVTAYNLSCFGMGISFLGDTLIQNVPETKNLVFYKLSNRNSVREVNFYYKRSRYMSKITSEFLKMSEDYL